MAIKPIPSSPFPLCSPIALRRQAVNFRRRSSLLPPRSLANSGCSGEPLRSLLLSVLPRVAVRLLTPTSLARMHCRCCCVQLRRARAAASTSATDSGRTPTRLDPLPAPSASPCPCARLVSIAVSRNPLQRSVAVAPPCSGEPPVTLTSFDPESNLQSPWICP